MTDALWTALTVAGFLLAQVIGVKPHAAGPAISPVAFTAKGNDQEFDFLQGSVTTELANWERMLLAKELDAWAFAYEATIVVNDERTDVFMVRAWAKDLGKSILITQAWRRSKAGDIELLGPPLLMENDKAPNSTGLPLSVLNEEQERAVRDGMARNAEAHKKGWLGTPPP
jgi:hypothetical protein